MENVTGIRRILSVQAVAQGRRVTQEDWLRFRELARDVIDGHSKCRAEYRALEEYLGTKNSKGCGRVNNP